MDFVILELKASNLVSRRGTAYRSIAEIIS